MEVNRITEKSRSLIMAHVNSVLVLRLNGIVIYIFISDLQL